MKGASSSSASSDADIPAAASAALSKPVQKTGADYLALAREAAGHMFNEVENVICQERVTRFRTRHEGSDKPIDVIEAKVSVEDGNENYSDILQNDHPRSAMPQIGGAWSQGEYATFLREAGRILGSPDYITEGFVTTLNGVPAVLFPYDVAEGESTWDFIVRGHRYMLGFHGELWISRETGELLRSRRICRRLHLSTGISEVDWTVDFAKAEIGGRMLSVPKKALYSVTYTRDLSREWNLMSFYNYRRFASESTIHFTEAGQESAVHP